jgi:D-lyxose ketol-isomerase
MKRSEINAIMRDSLKFLRDKQFLLPPFAHWTPDDWQKKGPECREIVEQQLGWDITDFGSGDFAREGLFLFTIRNGTLADLKAAQGKTYAEKIMIVRENQLTPTHFHAQKMEDIINRGGGNLVIRLWNATAKDDLADTPVSVSTDGVRVTVPAGGTLTLRPGESVCLPQRNYHCFWGEPGKGTVLVGEVSRVNDDRTDNHFHKPVGRFPEIQEDEKPIHLLYGDYARFLPARITAGN